MRIILIGFMGVGKTSVGKELAKRLEVDFIDTDCEIEKIVNKDIPEIFKNYGEKYFRKLETKVLKDLIQHNDIIISTGGGIITSEENREILKNEEKIIFLDASTETIIEHLSKEVHKRPLLKDSENLYKRIDELMSMRYNKYKEVCDISIDVNGKNIDEVISQILVYIR
jgi:shikimate kinase